MLTSPSISTHASGSCSGRERPSVRKEGDPGQFCGCCQDGWAEVEVAALAALGGYFPKL